MSTAELTLSRLSDTASAVETAGVPAGQSSQDASTEAERQASAEALAGAIRDLVKQEQLVLSLYYKDELTMREVGQVLGLSTSAVRRTRNRALARVRAAVAPVQGLAA